MADKTQDHDENEGRAPDTAEEVVQARVDRETEGGASGTMAITQEKLDKLATRIVQEARRRKANKSDAHRRWKEVDRQVNMNTITSSTQDGTAAVRAGWMPEVELGLQAETLEITQADCRRLMFPDQRDFFSVYALMEDDIVNGLVEDAGLVAGIDADTQQLLKTVGRNVTEVDGDTYNEINAAALRHVNRMYRVRDVWDMLNASAIKYGEYHARVMPVKANVMHAVMGGHDRRNAPRIPALIPRSAWDCFPDDNQHAMMNEGVYIEPSMIEWTWRRLPDLKRAAMRGGTQFGSANGGWLKRAVANIEPLVGSGAGRDLVQMVEEEGDLLIPMDQGKDIFIPNAIVTVLVGQGGPKVVRLRKREYEFRSYISGYYGRHSVDSLDSLSPLILGASTSRVAVEALNTMMAAAALDVRPPVSFDGSDPRFMATGGPVIEPGALWNTVGEVKTHDIGDISSMLQLYSALLGQYSNSTGVNAPRLGAQTKSHQTAFAVGSEGERGLVRTVDYVRQQQYGPMAEWLQKAQIINRREMKNQPIFLDKYEAYVMVGGSSLAEVSTFDVHGASAPLKEREDEAKKLQAITLAINLEAQKITLAQATGVQPDTLNIDELQRTVLRDGGFNNVDEMIPDKRTADETGPTPSAGNSAGAEQAANDAGVPSGAEALAFDGASEFAELPQ